MRPIPCGKIAVPSYRAIAQPITKRTLQSRTDNERCRKLWQLGDGVMEQATLSFADSLFNGSQQLDNSNESGSLGGQSQINPQNGTNSLSFGQTLQSAIQDVNSLQTNAAQEATSFALGQTSDIHTVMIAGEKASLALDLATEVRNKIVDAYQTVMQTSM
jgi:flagellar hook-basal body complex protein FliE